MSEKIKDNEFDENKSNAPDTEEKAFNPDEVNFEQNDNWEFEAKALTLENNEFESEVDLPETTEEKEEAKEEEKAEKAEEPKEVEKPKKKEKPAPAAKPKNEKQTKLSKNAVKFIATGIAIVILAGVLTFFGIRYYTVPNTNEKMNPGNVALRVDEIPVSIGMYNYYYNAVSNNYISYAQQGYYDLDTSIDYSKQKTTDEDGNEVTWAERFELDTIDRIQYISAYYQEAKKHGVTLTDTQKEEIESSIKSLEESASESDLSVDEYISTNYGDYCGLATIRKLLEQSYTANNYYRQYLIENKVDKKDVDAYYEEHKDDFTQIKFAYLPIVYTEGDAESMAKAEADAKKYASKIKNLKDLKKLIPTACKEIIDEYVTAGQFDSADDCAEAIAESVETTLTKSDTSFTEDAVNWLFAESTKLGDCSYFNDESNSVYFIVLKTGEPEISDEEVYSVRHILIMPKSDEKSEETEETTEKKEYTKEQWADAEKEAKTILSEYNKGDKTEYSFALLAEKYSEDTESTSNGSSGMYGGLYEGTPRGQMVKSFEEWATDDSRKYGDTGIVKSEYGYHIMYFVEDTTSNEYKCELEVQSQKETEYIKTFKVKKYKRAMKKTTVAKPTASDSDEVEIAE